MEKRTVSGTFDDSGDQTLSGKKHRERVLDHVVETDHVFELICIESMMFNIFML